MVTVALPIDWRDSPNGLVPVDAKLYTLAMEFCKRELAEVPKLTDYRKVWVAAQLGADGKLMKVTGIQALQMCVDLPISRYTDSKSALLLSSRVDSWCADQGLRGANVFVYLSSTEKPEQKCKGWDSWLKFWKAIPADRFLVKVR